MPRRSIGFPLTLGSVLILLVIALAAGSAWLTLSAQRAGGAVNSLATLPLASRLSNAVVAYVAYLADTCWPVALSVFYRYPSFGWPPALIAVHDSSPDTRTGVPELTLVPLPSCPENPLPQQ